MNFVERRELLRLIEQFAGGLDRGIFQGDEHVIWETRSGQKVRILCVDAPRKSPIAGYFIDDKMGLYSWYGDGAFLDTGEQSGLDLIIPEGVTIGGA